MAKRKLLKELTIKDNFMFGAVMSDSENCRKLLELVLGIPIAHVEVCKEKSLIYHPEYKGVRLDVYASDENRTHYDIEMQMVKKTALGKRTRYYHSQVDMELLAKNADYAELPNAFVIFICDFDPFGWNKYCYWFRSCCKEVANLVLEDGRETIFLNTHGDNETEVSEALVKFLKFVKADLKGSEENFHDGFVDSLQKAVGNIKASREMGERYMLFEEMMRDERNEGREEGKLEKSREDILELLEDFGEAPEQFLEALQEETDPSLLKALLKAAARAGSMEEFLEKVKDIWNSANR